LPRIGHIRRRLRRLLIIHGPMPTGELARNVYPRPHQECQVQHVRRTLPGIAVEDRRQRSRGEPIIWRLK
jgi:hypothetical protein